ncbi:hypothetical protein D3C86_1801610 [compost metagenome]
MKIGTLRHLVLADIRYNQFLAMQLMGTLDSCSENWMRLSRISPNNNHQLAACNIMHGAGISAETHGSK